MKESLATIDSILRLLHPGGVKVHNAHPFLPYEDDEGRTVHCWKIDGEYHVSQYVWDRLVEVAKVGSEP